MVSATVVRAARRLMQVNGDVARRCDQHHAGTIISAPRARQAVVPACQSIALVRRFQTGSRLQRTKDSSSVDFACFPSVPDVNPSRESIQVPYLPDLYKVPVPSLSHEPEVIEPVFRAEISTVAMESTHAHPPSAMSDVVDNAAIILDPYELTTQVDQAARKMGEKVVTDDREAKGMLKQIWTGLVDDVLGTSSLKPT